LHRRNFVVVRLFERIQVIDAVGQLP
jgi:hypothetical protein